MSIRKQNSNLEHKIKKNIMPITINTNVNPNNYLFVNKKSPIASLYLKMGQKMKSKKLKNTKSCSNLQNSDDSLKNNVSNNSFQLPNLSMLKNLKTNNNISGYITNRAQNNAQKYPSKQDYIIHVNVNHNHKSSVSNFLLNNNKREKKSSINKYNAKVYKNNISLNNSEFNNSFYCQSTRNKFNPIKDDKLDLKKIKNNMKTKKFKNPFNERKKNKYASASFCNLKNNNRTTEKSENKIISNNLSQNRINNNNINYIEKKIQHSRFNTMIIDEKDISIHLPNKKNKSKASKQNSNIKHNNSLCSIQKSQINDSLINVKSNKNINDNINYHIKNTLSMNGNNVNKIIYDNNLITKDKNNKKIINDKNKKNKTIKNNNSIFERKVKINRKDLLQEIKNKLNNKKYEEAKNKAKKEKKAKQNEKFKKGKIKEFSKIIVLDDYKLKKTAIDFHNDKFNKINKNNTLENSSKTKRDTICKNNSIMNNSKSKESLQIEKMKSFKPKKAKNNSSLINDSLEQKIINNFNKDNNNIKDSNNIIEYTSRFNVTCFPFPLINSKKTNYKKPLIKITAKSNISFNKNANDKENKNTSNANNSEIMSINQNNLLFQDKSLIIKKKKSIGNNSFHINKKLICYSSRAANNNNINTKEIKNSLFDYDNLEQLPEIYDEKFDDLYAVVRKINFGSVLIGAESLFCFDSHKYKEFQNNFDALFIKQYNKQNIDENKGKYLKKINNSCSTKTDFSSSNKNFYKNIYNNSIVPNEFEISEYT